MSWNPRQRRAAALFIFMITLPSIAIAIRAWACWILRHTRRVGMDDFFAFAALPFSVALNASLLWYMANGLGEHQIQVTPDQLVLDAKIAFIGDFMYDAGITLPKLSVLFFYARVFENTSKNFKRVLWLLGFMVVAWFVVVVLLTSLQCTPVRSVWDATVKQQHCIGTWNYILGTAVISVVIDLGILLAPIPKLLKLHMGRSRKVFLVILFLFGYSVIICSIGRLVSLAKVKNYQTDATWIAVAYVEWVASEAPVSVISVSLPIIYHFFKSIYDHGIQFAFTGQKSPSNDRRVKAKSSFFSFSSQRIRAEIRGYRHAGSEKNDSATSNLKRVGDADEGLGI